MASLYADLDDVDSNTTETKAATPQASEHNSTAPKKHVVPGWWPKVRKTFEYLLTGTLRAFPTRAQQPAGWSSATSVMTPVALKRKVLAPPPKRPARPISSAAPTATISAPFQPATKPTFTPPAQSQPSQNREAESTLKQSNNDSFYATGRNKRSKKQGKGPKRVEPDISEIYGELCAATISLAGHHQDLDLIPEPSQPNEYDICKQMIKRRKQEARERKIAEAMHALKGRKESPKPKRGRSPSPDDVDGEPIAFIPQCPPPQAPPVAYAPPTPISKPAAPPPMDLSGEDAYLRRMRMSGMGGPPPAPRPASPPPVPMEEEEGEEEGGAGMGFGWTGGLGLGASNDQPPPQRSQMSFIKFAQPSTAGPPIEIGPTRVLLLTNMVGAGEVDEDLEGETAAECGKFGVVERCIVHEVAGHNVPDDEAVRIFVRFRDAASAIQAKNDLHRRYFGGRVVTASFYDEDKFERRELAPR
ncbi:hypothetical protein HDV00_008668 [Rhizophlyctis rosea]|nr:hypothetical protein HDV00_008668 [Rhizophlyctis rosea]